MPLYQDTVVGVGLHASALPSTVFQMRFAGNILRSMAMGWFADIIARRSIAPKRTAFHPTGGDSWNIANEFAQHHDINITTEELMFGPEAE